MMTDEPEIIGGCRLSYAARHMAIQDSLDDLATAASHPSATPCQGIEIADRILDLIDQLDHIDRQHVLDRIKERLA